MGSKFCWYNYMQNSAKVICLLDVLGDYSSPAAARGTSRRYGTSEASVGCQRAKKTVLGYHKKLLLSS